MPSSDIMAKSRNERKDRSKQKQSKNPKPTRQQEKQSAKMQARATITESA